MSEIRIEQNNNIRYRLQTAGRSTIIMSQEPIGWDNDYNPELIRHKDYHGIFNEFTIKLGFRRQELDFIKSAFVLEGVNAKVYLIKEITTNNISYITPTTYLPPPESINWETDYVGLADWETMEESNNVLSLKFNTNDLQKLIDDNRSNTFELGTNESIEGNEITELDRRNVVLSGRGLQNISQWVLFPQDINYEFNTFPGTTTYSSDLTPRATLSVTGPDRSDNVTDSYRQYNEGTLSLPSHMFYVDRTNIDYDVNLTIEYDLSWNGIAYPFGSTNNNCGVYLEQWRFNVDTSIYESIGVDILLSQDNQTSNAPIENTGSIQKNGVKHNDGFVVSIKSTQYSTNTFFVNATCYKWDLKVTQVELAPQQERSQFMFVDTMMDRLMEILTGERQRFYSIMFGRFQDETEQGLTNRNYLAYGVNAYKAVISGLWARSFPKSSDKYKSLQMSMKESIDSLKAVFNIGISLDIIEGKQALRIEDLKYYYQNRVVVKLGQVNDVKRKPDNDLYIGQVELGYNKGGSYEDDLGLDEPNVLTEWVTPLNTPKKMSKISKIRSDEYGLELTRQKPYALFPLEDTSEDLENWFLSLKASPPATGSRYKQLEPNEIVVTQSGVLQPNSYRGAFFTPLQMLRRHGWVIRAGMEQASNFAKKIKYINSKTSTTLFSQLLGDTEGYYENEDFNVNDLERPRFLPEIITFTHPVSEQLWRQIKGRTEVLIDGFDVNQNPLSTPDNCPNLYFQFEWINEKQETERGYLLGLKRGTTGEFTMQKVNDNIIF